MSNHEELIGRFSTQSNRKMLRYLNLCLGKHDITLEQWAVLMSLSKEQQINQKQLSEITDKDQTTLTRILDILQRKELVQRQTSKQDRRSFIILLTDKGNALKLQIAQTTDIAYEKILNNISRDNLDIYREVLIKMNDNITNEMKDLKYQ